MFRRVDGDSVARTLSVELRASRDPSLRRLRAIDSSASGLPRAERRAEGSPPRSKLDGRALSIPYQELVLLVRGEITRESHNENKIATPRTRRAGALSPGLLLHLYTRESRQSPSRSIPDHFRWPDGAESTQSALPEPRVVPPGRSSRAKRRGSPSSDRSDSTTRSRSSSRSGGDGERPHPDALRRKPGQRAGRPSTTTRSSFGTTHAGDTTSSGISVPLRVENT